MLLLASNSHDGLARELTLFVCTVEARFLSTTSRRQSRPPSGKNATKKMKIPIVQVTFEYNSS